MTKGEGQETVSCLLEIVMRRQHDFNIRGRDRKWYLCLTVLKEGK